MKPRPFSRSAEKMIGEFRHLAPNDPPNMRRRDTKELGAVLEDLRIKHGIGRSTPEDAIRENWVSLVGSANATYSHAVRLDYGRRLIVSVTHSVVRNELFMHRLAIVEKLQKLPGCAGVTDLRLIPG